MEALSALTIGNNVQRARVRGAQEQLVAAIATAQAGCTPGIRGWALRIRESLRLSIRWWQVRNQTPEVDLHFSDYGVYQALTSSGNPQEDARMQRGIKRSNQMNESTHSDPGTRLSLIFFYRRASAHYSRVRRSDCLCCRQVGTAGERFIS